MARIRTLKPEFWDHSQLAKATLLARLTFVGLINFADDEGRGRADTEWLWGRLHSGQGGGVKAGWLRTLSELEALKDDDGPLVVFYEVAGARYYWLPGFCRQQYIEKPGKSKLPDPPQFPDSSPTPPGRVASGTGIRDQGSRKGREAKTPLPEIAPQRDPEPEAQQTRPAEDSPERAEAERVADAYGAWAHPSREKKLEAFAELRAMGVSFDVIRSGAQLNKAADVDFWGVVAALKAARRSAGGNRAKVAAIPVIPDEERTRVNGNPTGHVPPVLAERREVVQKRQDEARDKCDAAINAMDPRAVEEWIEKAQVEAETAKIPKGPARESFIKSRLRTWAAAEFSIEGV